MARKQLTPSRKELRDYDEFSKEAVFEAEFLALLMEHPHTPSELVGCVRFVLIGALDRLREHLKEQNGDGQMVRDIFPHAALVEPGFGGAFKHVLDEAVKIAPRVVNSIQAHADRGEVPPRYPHPLKELFRKHRDVFGMDGREKAEPKGVTPKRQRPETATAEHLAALLEAPETPPVVRALIRVACESIDTASAEHVKGEEYPRFEFGDSITPALIRRKLPKMLRKVGDWHLDKGLLGIGPDAGKGGQ